MLKTKKKRKRRWGKWNQRRRNRKEKGEEEEKGEVAHCRCACAASQVRLVLLLCSWLLWCSIYYCNYKLPSSSIATVAILDLFLLFFFFDRLLLATLKKRALGRKPLMLSISGGKCHKEGVFEGLGGKNSSWFLFWPDPVVSVIPASMAQFRLESTGEVGIWFEIFFRGISFRFRPNRIRHVSVGIDNYGLARLKAETCFSNIGVIQS